MINYVIYGGIVAIAVTTFILEGIIIYRKIKRYRNKKLYEKLIKQKISILAQLQEEERKVSESAIIPQTPLPAQFFEQNYTEVKV